MIDPGFFIFIAAVGALAWMFVQEKYKQLCLHEESRELYNKLTAIRQGEQTKLEELRQLRLKRELDMQRILLSNKL